MKQRDLEPQHNLGSHLHPHARLRPGLAAVQPETRKTATSARRLPTAVGASMARWSPSRRCVAGNCQCLHISHGQLKPVRLLHGGQGQAQRISAWERPARATSISFFCPFLMFLHLISLLTPTPAALSSVQVACDSDSSNTRPRCSPRPQRHVMAPLGIAGPHTPRSVGQPRLVVYRA